MDANELAARQFKINEDRQSAILAQRALVDDTGGDFNAEQRAEYDRMEQDIVRLEAQRDVLGVTERRANEAGELREQLLRKHGEKLVVRSETNEAQMWRDFLSRENRNDGREIQLDMRPAITESRLRRQGMDASEARALAWDTGSIASGVPTTTAAQLYQLMEASIAAFKMPFTRINTSSGEQMKFPKINAHGIATQVSGQGTTLAGTDPTFLSMTLDAYKYGELVIAATEVVADTSFDIVGFVVANIARALGRKIDTDIMTGSGSGLPQGVMTGITGSGTIATGGSLIDPTYEKLIDLKYSVNDAYRSGGNCAWLMHDLTASVIRKIRDGAGGTVGAVMWLPSLTSGIQGGQPDMLLGSPTYIDPNVASLASNAKVMAFGGWEGYYFRTIGNIAVERDDSRYFDTDQVGFRGKWRVDGDYIDTTAVNIMKRSV